ncbi:MAG: NAD-dependent epimerase/dehydratase family protein [Pseudobdellovibrionaceae bacterium]|nr:NAD-dependent epimerase/dehydratase family protein [Pseudobdellovibrionaceae bacterium]
MVRSFVTGATGFLGSHLVRRLIQEGHQLTLMARRPDFQLFPHHYPIQWVSGDVLDSKEQLAKLMDRHQRVYHLAGLIGYRPELRQRMFEVNVLGTEHLVDAAMMAGVEKFFYVSSVAAIGASTNPHEILNEESAYNLKERHWGYFDSKHEAERRLIQKTQSHPIMTYILNPSTIYGAGDWKKGSRKVQLLVARGKMPFCPPGGVNVVHVEDVIESFILLEKFGKKNRRYIIAHENILLKTLFEWIAQVAKAKPPRVTLPCAILKGIGYFADFANYLGLRMPFNSENAGVACLYHWFSNERAKAELQLSFRSSFVAVKESIESYLSQGV